MWAFMIFRVCIVPLAYRDKGSTYSIPCFFDALKRGLHAESPPYITQVIYLDNLGDGVDSRLSERGWAAFNSFGTQEEAAYMDWAKQYIGISDWSKVIR